jgi:hypothetical protein
MHKTFLATSALATLFAAALAMPAPAQMMCAPGQPAQASSPQQSAGMMCGMMGRQVQDNPMTQQPAQPQQRAGMCPCCRNMAMMGGGMMDGQQQNPQQTPGTQTPQQQ